MKLDPNDFQCVKKLAAIPIVDGGLSSGVDNPNITEYAKYEDYLTFQDMFNAAGVQALDTVVDNAAQDLSYKLAYTLQTLAEATSGAMPIPPPVKQQIDAHSIWEKKIKDLEDALENAIKCMLPNVSHLTAELAAIKLSYNGVKIEVAQQKVYELQKPVVSIPAMPVGSITSSIYTSYKPDVAKAKEEAAQTTQSMPVKFYDSKFIANLKAQLPFPGANGGKPDYSTYKVEWNKGLKPNPIVVSDDEWDEGENRQLKFFQKIGVMSNLNVIPQSRKLRSLGGLMVHRLLCDNCKESLDCESVWITNCMGNQPEILKFCNDHRHIVEVQQVEGRKFRE